MATQESITDGPTDLDKSLSASQKSPRITAELAREYFGHFGWCGPSLRLVVRIYNIDIIALLLMSGLAGDPFASRKRCFRPMAHNAAHVNNDTTTFQTLLKMISLI